MGEDMDGAQSREGAETIHTASMATRRPQRGPSMTRDTKCTKDVVVTVHSGNSGLKLPKMYWAMGIHGCSTL